MKKKPKATRLLVLSLLMVLLLVACEAEERSPANEEVAPTSQDSSPPVEPTATRVPSTAELTTPETVVHTPDPDLIGATWGWEARDPNGSDADSIDVPNPEHYSLSFNEDGTFDAVMDCNNGQGSYLSGAGGEFTMGLGPTTMVECPPGSLADAMGAMFGSVESYRLEENGDLLVFSWTDGGPLDYLRRLDRREVALPDAEEGAGTTTGVVTAPAGIYLRTGPGTNYPYVGVAAEGDRGEVIGISEDGSWWLVSAPDLQRGQVWVSAQYLDVLNGRNVPVVSAHALELDLESVPWEWVSTSDAVQGPVAVADPSRYLLRLNGDGRANITADCNQVQATYTLDGSRLTIIPGPSTRAMCPADSQASAFLQQLGAVAGWLIQGGNLYLDLMADGGTMRFVPQGAPVPAPQPAAGEAEANTLYLVSFGPQGSPEPLIAGTAIVASWADDWVSGFAGCNNYSGTVTPSNGYFDISDVVSTRKTCPEPAGVMEQEAAYLAALETVNGYEWRSEAINGVEVVTEGQLFYALPGGSKGVMNFTADR